jgi:hypothetical protein
MRNSPKKSKPKTRTEQNKTNENQNQRTEQIKIKNRTNENQNRTIEKGLRDEREREITYTAQAAAWRRQSVQSREKK